MAHGNDVERDLYWKQGLAAFSIPATIIALALPLTFIMVVGDQPGDLARGEALRELLMASRAPNAYRVAMVFETLLWLAFGITLVLLAGLLHRHAPRRAALIAAAGAGQAVGMLTGCLRLALISPLAAQYASDPDTAIRLFPGSQRLAQAPWQAGSLILGVGFFMAATVAWTLPGFPRWLAGWMFIPALLPLVQFVVVATGHPFIVPLAIANNVVGYGAMSLAMALAFRPD
jgi:hypothetical protein